MTEHKDPQLEVLSAILVSINTIHDKIERLEEVRPAVEEIRRDLQDHIKDEMTTKFIAFPDGDPEGHRRSHEAQIRRAEADAKAAEDRADVWLAAKKKAAEMTVYAFLGCAVIILVYYWNGHMPTSAHITLPVK